MQQNILIYASDNENDETETTVILTNIDLPSNSRKRKMRTRGKSSPPRIIQSKEPERSNLVQQSFSTRQLSTHTNSDNLKFYFQSQLGFRNKNTLDCDT